MSKLTFKIDKKIDFRNHLIQMHWRDKTGFDFDKESQKYLDSLQSSKNIQEQWDKFEKYSADFYSEENKNKVQEIINYYQESWKKIEDKYIEKMEEIHGGEFPYEKVFGILSTTPMGWGFNFNDDDPWFACPNKINQRFLKVAMHEMMHGFFQKYFMEEYRKRFDLDDNQVWAVQESLTVLLNLELGDILPGPDMGYPAHKELREEVEQIWLKNKNINKVLENLCEMVKSK